MKITALLGKPEHRKRNLALALAAILFAWFVFPTPYEKVHFNSRTYRVNRITGHTQVFGPSGWRDSNIGSVGSMPKFFTTP